MNEINVRNTILDSIDEIKTVTMESTLDVFGSLAAAYDKAVMITEYSTSDDLSMFSIFQEAEVTEGEGQAAPTAEAKKEDSIGMKILMFIPNILKKIWQFIKDAWNGNIVPAAKEAGQAISNVSDKAKEAINQVLGKDESFIKANAGKIFGIGGAAVVLALTIAGFYNKDKLKKMFTDLMTKLSEFFTDTKETLRMKGVIFEMVVLGKFKTNVGFKGMVEAFKSLPEFFRKCTEFKARSLESMLTELRKGNQMWNDAAAAKANGTAGATNPLDAKADEILKGITILDNEAQQLGKVNLLMEEPYELTSEDIVNFVAGYDQINDQLVTGLQQAQEALTLSEEEAKKLTTVSKWAAIKNAWAKLMDFFKKIGGAVVSGIKTIKDFITGLVKANKSAKDLSDQMDNAGEGAPAEGEGTEGTGTEGEGAGEPGTDADLDAELGTGDTGAGEGAAPEGGEGTPAPEGEGVEESAETEIADGDTTVQESATDEEDLAVNNHWYK